MTDGELLLMAIDSAAYAYAPYSNYHVGAALLAKNGQVFCGCNIENPAHTPTVCAERTAFFKAISEGVRDFEKIAIVGGWEEWQEQCPPCGVCRQVMAEFCDKDTFRIILGNRPDNLFSYTLAEIFPLIWKAK